MVIEKIKNTKHTQALLTWTILSIILLFPVAQTCFSQECEGTQFRTDDRGLVYVPKGEKATLLINGVWCECWGCGDCVPISNSGRRPSIEPRSLSRREQRLSDEEIIQMIERAKALAAPVEAQDEARRKTEFLAFQDRISLLSRELRSLQDGSLTQFTSLKLRLQDLAEKATTIKEMGQIARWSLQAADNAFSSPESAREKAGWGFDDWARSSPVPDLSQLITEVPLPETQAPQFQAFRYISNWAGDMYTKILRLNEKQIETIKKGHEIENKIRDMRYKPIPLTTNAAEEERKKQEAIADLERQAKALLKEAEEMGQKAFEYSTEVFKMQQEFSRLIEDPSKCSQFLEERTGIK